MAPNPSDYGKVGAILCGGSFRGYTQLSRIREVMRAGFKIGRYITHSVGSYNAMALVEKPGLEGVEEASDFWRRKITSPDKAFQPHPILQKKKRQLEMRYDIHSPFHRHNTWPEWWDDWKNCLGHLSNRTILLADSSFMGVVLGARTALKIFQVAHMSSDAPRPPLALDIRLKDGFRKVLRHLDLEELMELGTFIDQTPLVEKLFKEIDCRKIIESPIPWDIFTQCVETEEEVVFRAQDASSEEVLQREIRASAAPIFYCDPVEINGKCYFDNGWKNPVPISYAFNQGCDTVFVFFNQPADYVERSNLPFIGKVITECEKITRELRAELIMSAWRRAKEEEKNLFVSFLRSLHPNLTFFNISPAAMEFHDRQDAEDMRKFMSNLERFNLKNFSEEELGRYLQNPFQLLDSLP